MSCSNVVSAYTLTIALAALPLLLLNALTALSFGLAASSYLLSDSLLLLPEQHRHQNIKRTLKKSIEDSDEPFKLTVTAQYKLAPDRSETTDLKRGKAHRTHLPTAANWGTGNGFPRRTALQKAPFLPRNSDRWCVRFA